MNDDTRKRLQRLRDDLDDMSGVWKPFGFGLLRSQPAVIPTRETLDYLDWLVCPQWGHEVKYHGKVGQTRGWLDQSPDWKYCLWWWGDKKGVEEFKKWGNRLYGLLSECPDLIPVASATEPQSGTETAKADISTTGSFCFHGPVEKPRLGYHGSLLALCSFAAQDTALARIEDRVVVDGRMAGPGSDVTPGTSLNLPPAGTFRDGLKYVFTEIDANGITFSRQILDRLLARCRHEFHVDVKKRIARLDDETFHIDDEDVLLVLRLYEEAAGCPLTYDEIREHSPLLKGVRIERVVMPKIPPPILDLIKRVPGKGSWLDLSCQESPRLA